MEPLEQKTTKNLVSWITSLAISITCCAVLFVIFAGYLADINKSIAIENIRLEEMAEHESQLLAEIQYIRRANPAAAQAGQPPAIAPGSVSTTPTEPNGTTVTPMPTVQTVTPSAAPGTSPVSTGTSAPTALTPSVTTPPSPSTPTPVAPVSPAAIPEVPATH